MNERMGCLKASTMSDIAIRQSLLLFRRFLAHTGSPCEKALSWFGP